MPQIVSAAPDAASLHANTAPFIKAVSPSLALGVSAALLARRLTKTTKVSNRARNFVYAAPAVAALGLSVAETHLVRTARQVDPFEAPPWHTAGHVPLVVSDVAGTGHPKALLIAPLGHACMVVNDLFLLEDDTTQRRLFNKAIDDGIIHRPTNVILTAGFAFVAVRHRKAWVGDRKALSKRRAVAMAGAQVATTLVQRRIRKAVAARIGTTHRRA